jgi:serine/threonine-protein kinase RsbW
MADSAVSREVNLTLPLLPDMEIAASKTATAIAELMEMSPDRVDEVRMAVVEACINSLEHSNSTDRKVHLTFAVVTEGDSEKLQVTVRDNGVGFSPNELKEPNIEEKLKAARKRGWGLKIISGLMDEVDLQSGPGGTTVVMGKYRDQGADE